MSEGALGLLCPGKDEKLASRLPYQYWQLRLRELERLSAPPTVLDAIIEVLTRMKRESD